MSTVETIKPVCISCEVNTALTFMELITKCDEKGINDEYMPIEDYSKGDTCYQCYEDNVSEYAQALYEIEHDL
jgi:hypothetical protein